MAAPAPPETDYRRWPLYWFARLEAALETGNPNYMPGRHHITWWPLARDVGGAHDSGLHDALGGGNSMPITAFYDAGGRLVDMNRGALPKAALSAELQELFGITTGASG